MRTLRDQPGPASWDAQEGRGWHGFLPGWRRGLPSLGILVALPTGGHGWCVLS